MVRRGYRAAGRLSRFGRSRRSRRLPSRSDLLTQKRGFIPSSLVERKYLDDTFAPTQQLPYGGTPANAALILLNDISLGNGANQRIGVEAMMRKLTLRLQFTTQFTVLNAAAVRFLVVWDNQPGSDLSSFTNDFWLESNVFASPIHPKSLKRFRILLDQVTDPICANSVSGLAFRYTVPINKSTRFTTASSTPPALANIQSGALYLVMFSETLQSSPGISVLYGARLSYDDA